MKHKNNRAYNGGCVNPNLFRYIPTDDELQYIKNSRLWAVWSPFRGLVYHSVSRLSCVRFCEEFRGGMIPYRVIRFDPNV